MGIARKNAKELVFMTYQKLLIFPFRMRNPNTNLD